MLKFKIFRGVKHSLKHELCCGPYFQCIRLSRWETDPLTLSQRDTVADVWATLTWSPYVSGPSPADLSQWRLILLDAYGFHAGVLITRQRVLLDAYGFHPGVLEHV